MTEAVQCPCPNCRANHAAAIAPSLALKARANLLRQAIRDRGTYGVVCTHAVELLGMLEARGLA